MAQAIMMLITAKDSGGITVDIRGTTSKEGILAILDAAKELVEQGNYEQKPHARRTPG